MMLVTVVTNNTIGVMMLVTVMVIMMVVVDWITGIGRCIIGTCMIMGGARGITGDIEMARLMLIETIFTEEGVQSVIVEEEGVRSVIVEEEGVEAVIGL